MRRALSGPEAKLKEEITSLKNKISDVEEQLKEEQKIRQKLRNEAEAKLKQIALVDESIAKEEKEYNESKQHVSNKLRVYSDRLRSKLQGICKDSNEITEYIAGFDIIEAENDLLNSRLKKLSIDWSTLSKQHEELREATKQKNFETRMQMDQILRNTIKSLDNDYKRNAVFNNIKLFLFIFFCSST